MESPHTLIIASLSNRYYVITLRGKWYPESSYYIPGCMLSESSHHFRVSRSCKEFLNVSHCATCTMWQPSYPAISFHRRSFCIYWMSHFVGQNVEYVIIYRDGTCRLIRVSIFNRSFGLIFLLVSAWKMSHRDTSHTLFVFLEGHAVYHFTCVDRMSEKHNFNFQDVVNNTHNEMVKSVLLFKFNLQLSNFITLFITVGVFQKFISTL